MHIRISLGQIILFDNSPHIPSFCISTFHYYNHADHNVVGGFLPLCVTPHSTPPHPISSNLMSSFHTYTMNILYLYVSLSFTSHFVCYHVPHLHITLWCGMQRLVFSIASSLPLHLYGLWFIYASSNNVIPWSLNLSK